MKIEKQKLIHAVLADDDSTANRADTLGAARQLLRHRRHKRVLFRLVPLLVMLAAIAALSFKLPPSIPHSAVATSSAPHKNHTLSDEQLLALFPGTPVGIATVNGKKILIFPRKEDEERFVGHF